jgi:hypothetical protein
MVSGLDAHRMAGAQNPQRDFAAIGNDNLLEGGHGGP